MIGDMVPPPAFPNGTSFERWQASYCDRCWHDRGSRVEPWDESRLCDLIGVGLAHLPVVEWVRSDTAPAGVHCTRFRTDDGGPDETIPTPAPHPPGQELLFDADPYDVWAAANDLAEVPA